MPEPTQYLGLDVLEVEPNRISTVEETYDRRFNVLDTLTGSRWADEMEAAPAPVRPFVWTAIGRAEALHMRQFIDNRKGRAVPFWLPSWQQDLTLAEDVDASDTLLPVRWVRYTQLMFPAGAARRHLCIFAPSFTPAYHYIADADDPLDEITETLLVTPAVGRDLPAATTILSFLKYCRLDEDQVSWVWESTNVLHALIRVREIPAEAPDAV